jgi:protein-S-isoprenylcysteine O-methyltransferase Ste14
VGALRELLKKRWQLLFDVYLFLNLFGWVVFQTARSWEAGEFGYVKAAFTIQNVVMVVMILVRRQHLAVDRNVLHQLVALVAFFSGLAMLGARESGPPGVLLASRTVTVAANVLGVATLLNLGRSFGILIARREVKTGGLYGLVRHPMYASDILLRVGFIISHWSWFNFGVVLCSSACYVYRAVLEERFLSEGEEYREYMRRVRYRFIPGAF